MAKVLKRKQEVILLKIANSSPQKTHLRLEVNMENLHLQVLFYCIFANEVTREKIYMKHTYLSSSSGKPGAHILFCFLL